MVHNEYTNSIQVAYHSYTGSIHVVYKWHTTNVQVHQYDCIKYTSVEYKIVMSATYKNKLQRILHCMFNGIPQNIFRTLL